MKTNHITLRPDKLGIPLECCAVGRASSAVFTIGGDIPDDIESLGVCVEYLDGDTVERYTAAGTRLPAADGNPETWRVYFAPSYFPAESDALKYHVIGVDASGNPRWLGTGNLRIFDNPADGSGAAPSIIPAGSYAYNPLTGLYYKLIAEQNEYGVITVSVDQTGVEL